MSNKLYRPSNEPKTIYDYEQLINEVNNCLRKQNGLETSTIEIIQMKQMGGGGRWVMKKKELFFAVV